MKTSIASSLLAALLFACGGGGTAPSSGAVEPSGPTGTTATPDDSDALPGEADNDTIPDKPKPFISVSSLLGASSARAATPAAPVSDADADQAIERVFEMFTELVEGMAGAADCAGVAASVRTWGTRHVAEFKALMPTLMALESKLSKEEAAALEQRMGPIGAKMEAAVKPCMHNEEVMGAFTELAKAVDEGEASADGGGAEKSGPE
jgi:hypothetical protein